MDNREVYIIGGPNGAGKTTSALYLLPHIMHNVEFINADSIAKGLSPFNPEGVAIQASKLMIKRIQFLTEKNISFAFETTMASRAPIKALNKCRNRGYVTNAIFLWLRTPELAVQRVKQRVVTGGHNIPEDIIIRRYNSCLQNFFQLYKSALDNWFLYDNSEEAPILIAQNINGKIKICNEKLWCKVKEKRK